MSSLADTRGTSGVLGVTPELGARSVLGAARKYVWLVAATTIAVAALGLAVSRVLPSQAVARSSVLLEDVSDTDVLGTANPQSQERLVQNQLEVFRSGVVATRAQELLAQQDIEMRLNDILTDVDATSVADTDVITVSYAAPTPEVAEAVVEAVVEAFQEVHIEQRNAATLLILERLDFAKSLLESELTKTRARMAEALAVRNLAARIANVLNELLIVEDQLATVTSANAREPLIERSNQLGERLATLKLATEVETESEELAPLIEARRELQRQLSELNTRRSEVQIQMESQGTGIAFIDPAQTTSNPEGAGTVFTIAASGFLGFLLGLSLAYARDSRRRVFSSRLEPELSLGISLLGDIPELKGDLLPVRDSPRDTAAEAFRFAASNIALAMDQESVTRTTFISAAVGDGKSVLTANTALALSRFGKKVLVIDGDFGHQALTKLLLGEISLTDGLTELVAGRSDLARAIRKIESGGGATIDFLSRGGMPAVAPDLFARMAEKGLLDDLASQYDAIFIDSPPFLQVAYAGTIARLAGSVVLVVPHESKYDKAAELINRAAFLRVNVLGYLYNKAPSRADMVESAGSMKDVLGDRGFLETVPKKAR